MPGIQSLGHLASLPAEEHDGRAEGEENIG